VQRLFILIALLAIAFTPALTKADDSASSGDRIALRIRFGMKDQDATDWSGSFDSSAKIESIHGWRWMPGDHANGKEFTVWTRRAQAQSRGQQKQLQAGNKLPMQDNGIVVTLAGAKPDEQLTFDTKPAKVKFARSDVPYGKKLMAENGSVEITRVPPISDVAQTEDDEDYPAIATAKDGTQYLVYLAFKRGKDFEGARERRASAESGPVVGPLAAGVVKKIEKAEDLDYLTQPTGGEQIYLRIRKPGQDWSDPIAVTDGKQELYRPAIAIDGKNNPWVFYPAHVDPDPTLDHGNWEILARSFNSDGTSPSAPINISNANGTDFMPSAAVDSAGVITVAWVGARKSNFNIFTATQTESGFSAAERLTDATANEWEPNVAADASGHLAIAYDTYAKGDYDVYVCTRGTDGKMSKPQAVAATLSFEVRPSMAYDSQGRLWIAYEESGDQWGKDFGALKKKGIPLYQGGRAVSVKALDPDGKWFAAPEVMSALPGANREVRGDNKRVTNNPNVTPRMVNQILPCYPRIAADSDGRIWLSFRGRPGGNWRVAVGSCWSEYITQLSGDKWSNAVWVPRSNNILDNRPAVAASKGALTLVFSGDGRGELNPLRIGDPHLRGSADGDDAAEMFTEEYAADDSTTATDSKDPESAGAPTTQPGADGAAPGGRGRGGRGGRRAAGAGMEINDDIFCTTVLASQFSDAQEHPQPALDAIEAAKPVAPSPDAEAERNAISAIREFRTSLNGEQLRIWRGEFHRHTELSPDGGGDGGLLDMWRYAIDAAGMDWIGDGDHDYGNGREYSWWTTQKAVTLFTLPGAFTPVYSYERSVVYPEGHRNCMFAQRGVRSLPRMPLSKEDNPAPAPDTNLLYVYLKHFKGLCASHTSATDMGTDWRNNDPEVEPLVEIYQGDRNNYERPDAPRTAVTEAKLKQSTPEKESLGGWRPKGFVNLALKKGYRLAFESSSDHMSTHLSYCSVLVDATKPPTREAILDAIRHRRVYGATDNIIAEFKCKAGDTDHMMGEEFAMDTAPSFNIHLIGTQKFKKITIIKDDEEVHSIEPDKQDVTLTWTDPSPSAGKTSYYYVRGEQVPDMDGVTSGELVWASPMWIKYEPKK